MPLPPFPRAALAVGLALGSALAVATSLAAERLSLTWQAPAECPGEADVRAEVDRLLGASHVEPKKPIDVTAAVSRDDQGTWHVRLTTASEGGPRTREVHGASCRAISNAAALILALMIDPEAVAAAPAASSSASPSAPSSSTPPALDSGSPSVPVAPGIGASTSKSPGASTSPAASTSPLPPQRPSRPPVSSRAPAISPSPENFSFGFGAGVWAGVDAGTLPGVSAGFGATGALFLGPQRIEIGFAARPAQRAVVAVSPAKGGDIELLTGSMGTCRSLLSRPIELGPCVAVEAGRLHAEGFGVSAPGKADQPWIAVSAGGLFAWSPAAHVALLIRLDAVVPLVRSTFILEGVGHVHTPSPVTGRASAGVELRF